MSAIFGETLTFGQSNGGDVRLKVFGDEHYARYEDLNGYTVVYDNEMGRSDTVNPITEVRGGKVSVKDIKGNKKK